MTEQILREMLCENTGVALCDSGGTPKYDENGKYIGTEHGYGRHFEINQGVDFDKNEHSLSFTSSEPDVTLDVYKWLSERVEYDEEMNGLFEEFCKEEDSDESWLSLMVGFPEYLEDRGMDVRGFYRDRNIPAPVNTYNSSCLLSQVLQYVYFSIDDTEYVVLQIHNGADVRGGYTRPRVFSLTSEISIFDNAKANIVCEDDSDHSWFTDDAYTWYSDNGEKKLGEYDFHVMEKGESPKEGYICIRDGQGHCPICGGKLKLRV
jgi:hypothetical protein